MNESSGRLSHSQPLCSHVQRQDAELAVKCTDKWCGCKLLHRLGFSARSLRWPKRWCRKAAHRQTFLPPPAPLRRLPIVPTSSNPQWRLKSPHWCHQWHATCSDVRTGAKRERERGRRAGEERHSRDLPKGNQQRANGAPQSVHPVSAAFNRMSWVHRLLCHPGVNRKRAARGENPLKMLTLLK